MEATVCVVGSINSDTTLRVAAIPEPGSTVLTTAERRVAPGGKGANQAAAAAVLGARVAMVGAVGADDAGRRSLAALTAVGVDVDGVLRRDDVGTGIAVITVEDRGENTIVVDPGANATLAAHEAVAAVEALAPAVVVLQLEVPVATVVAVARAARTATVVLDPAPMPADACDVRDVLAHIDVLVPNRSELGRLAGRPEPTTPDQVVDCLAALDHPGSVVVTLGADGAVCAERGADPVHVAGEATRAVDASGAGDVFRGCVAHELARGTALVDAVRRANRLAAAHTTYPGARIPPGLRA